MEQTKNWLGLRIAVPELMVTPYYKKGKISKDLYDRFKPRTGPSPIVFRVTEEGRRAVGLE